MYDVIVIGAGPSGCVAAKTLADCGHGVLLLEKCKLPRYKSCSGVLIEKSLQLIEKLFGKSVPESVTCTPADNRGMVFYDDNGKEYRFESRGLNIWRDKFDYWLASCAAESGAELRDGCHVSSVSEEDGEVVVTAGTSVERAKYVIDCSGAVGIGKRAHSNIITYQTYNKGAIDLNPHYFYAYLQPELSGYDAWFNVKDGMLVLGVASEDGQAVQRCYGEFIAYMTRNYSLRIDERLREDKWVIRKIKPPYDIDYGGGRVLKAGENAGFLNPMGEGISCALESGYFAACAVVGHCDDASTVAQAYMQSCESTKNYMRRQWELVGRMSDKFAHMYKK